MDSLADRQERMSTSLCLNAWALRQSCAYCNEGGKGGGAPTCCDSHRRQTLLRTPAWKNSPALSLTTT